MDKKGLENELSEKIAYKVIQHRNNFSKLFLFRLFEQLPNLISHKVRKGDELNAIDFNKVEIALRDGYHVAIGKSKENGAYQMLGTITNNQTISEPTQLWQVKNEPILTGEDINFIVNIEESEKKKLKEITLLDNAKTGNFVVLRNKTLNLLNDKDIIAHYTKILAEIEASRMSLVIQTKAMTFFSSEIGDETMNKVIDSWYNGSPYEKVSKLFNAKDNIVTIDNSNLVSNLNQLHKEFQNELNMMNSMLGVDGLGVSKESGVSDIEANSSESFTRGNGNIYLDGRQKSYDLLAKRFNDINIQVMYNNQVANEMRKLQFIERVID